MLSEDDYDRLADRELHFLVDALDALARDDLEAELQSGILTIELSSDKYVINSHRAARQIWMAAERSAWHFDWDESSSAWVATKDGAELWSTLQVALGRKLGDSVSLVRPAAA